MPGHPWWATLLPMSATPKPCPGSCCCIAESCGHWQAYHALVTEGGNLPARRLMDPALCLLHRPPRDYLPRRLPEEPDDIPPCSM